MKKRWRRIPISYKAPVLKNNTDIDKIVAPNKYIFGKQDFKYFIDCKDNKETRPLYTRYSDKTKCMYFMIKDEKLFD